MKEFERCPITYQTVTSLPVRVTLPMVERSSSVSSSRSGVSLRRRAARLALRCAASLSGSLFPPPWIRATARPAKRATALGSPKFLKRSRGLFFSGAADEPSSALGVLSSVSVARVSVRVIVGVSDR